MKYLINLINIYKYKIMRSLLSIVLLLISTLISYSQAPPVKYQSGADAEDNLNRIINISPTVTGGMGFDTRFEGVKGSPRLFEKLLPSFVKIDGQNEYFKLNADLDI